MLETLSKISIVIQQAAYHLNNRKICSQKYWSFLPKFYPPYHVLRFVPKPRCTSLKNNRNSYESPKSFFTPKKKTFISPFFFYTLDTGNERSREIRQSYIRRGKKNHGPRVNRIKSISSSRGGARCSSQEAASLIFSLPLILLSFFLSSLLHFLPRKKNAFRTRAPNHRN